MFEMIAGVVGMIVITVVLGMAGYAIFLDLRDCYGPDLIDLKMANMTTEQQKEYKNSEEYLNDINDWIDTK